MKRKRTINRKQLSIALNLALDTDSRPAKQVAEELELDRSVFSRYLSGQTAPDGRSYRFLKAWAAKNGVDLDKVVGNI